MYCRSAVGRSSTAADLEPAHSQTSQSASLTSIDSLERNYRYCVSVTELQDCVTELQDCLTELQDCVTELQDCVTELQVLCDGATGNV